MEETAETLNKTRENIRISSEKIIDQPVASVTPETENLVEIAEEMLDVGGKKEGDEPSRSLLRRLEARIKAKIGGQKELLEKAA